MGMSQYKNLVISLWKNQFKEAIFVESNEPSPLQRFIHIVIMPWKILFAFIPPTDVAQGYISFVIAIICIGTNLGDFIGIPRFLEAPINFGSPTC